MSPNQQLPGNQHLAELVRLLASSSYTFVRAEDATDLALVHEACATRVRYVGHETPLDDVGRSVRDHMPVCPAAVRLEVDVPQHRELEVRHVSYTAPTGLVTRPLRAFRTGPQHVTCFVTEQGDGMSITNTASEVHAALHHMWPNSVIRVIEHYPADGTEPAHYDEAFTAPGGRSAWRRLSTAALLVEFDGRLPR